MVLVLMRVIGIGIETADMLVREILSRNLRDRRAVARYGGLRGSPDESGKSRREKGLARSGNARVRKGMIQLAWRYLDYQKESALAKWFRARTENVWVFGPPHARMWHESSCTCPQLPSTSSSRSQQVCRRARSP